MRLSEALQEHEERTSQTSDATGRSRSVIVVTVLVLVAPPLADLLLNGPRRLFSYVAADTFYYLRVADVWGESGALSFDGEHPTNGFHPLWQLLLAGAGRVLHWVDAPRTALLAVAVLGSLAALAATVVVVGRTLGRAYGRVPALLALLPVGVYALTLIPLWIALGGQEQDSLAATTDIPLLGTLWSFATGMETAVVLLAFAALVGVAVRFGFTGRAAVAGQAAAAGLLVLARLDNALIVAGWLAVLVIVAALLRSTRLLRSAVLIGGAVAAIVAVYVLWSQWYADAWLPVSGTSKSTFPDVDTTNARDIVDLLTFRDVSFGRSRLQREWPLVVPVVVAASWSVAAMRPRELRRLRSLDDGSPLVRLRLALTATAVGILLLSAYDLAFVPIWNQGHWYLPVSMVFVSLAAIDALERTSVGRRAGSATTPVMAASALVAATVFVTLGHPDRFNERFADFHGREAGRVRQHYGDDVPRLVSWDDGIDAFSLGFPSLSATGLMLDAEASHAYEEGRLLDLALDRGYDRFSSVQYLDTAGLDRGSTSEELRQRLAPYFYGEDLEDYDFAVEYTSPPGALAPPWPGADDTYVIIRIRRAA